MSMLRFVFPPMHPDGRRFVGVFLVVTLVAGLLWAPLLVPGGVLSAWCYYFFRDPPRVVPDRAGLIVSPADGTVSRVAMVDPPDELALDGQQRICISIFMSVFDAHVNRSPADGIVEHMVYTPGRFVNASLDKASEHNERNGMVLMLDDGRSLGVVQIAGLVARRIVPFVGTGRALRRGERFGLIRFGSRLDVYLPDGVASLVAVGQKTVSGETVLADLISDESMRPGRTE